MLITFKVSDVDLATTPLPTRPTASQLAALGWTAPEASRVGADTVVDGPLVHPLALAIDLAFAEHRPLVLGPDEVWLCLAQSLATHVELHAEALRPRLVRHQGQLELEARRDDFILGDPHNDWPGVVDALTAQIRGHLGGRADLFVADFSTTGPLARTASQIALMGAMRQYFRYAVATLCGIPEITLRGTPDDWASIRRRAAVFGEFDLGWWLEALDPVLAQLEATARGDVDRDFWRRLYKVEHGSGGDRSTGWFNTLFAYVGDQPRRNGFPTVDAGPFQGNQLSDFPAGRTRVPFVWRIGGVPVAMELVGGLWGAVQDPATGALGVTSGWVVSHARTESGFIRSPGGRGDGAATAWPTRLTVRTGLALETLEALRHEAGDEPVALLLPQHATLRSIEGIQHLRGIVDVSLFGAPLLESLAPLTGMTSVRRLDVSRCPRLANIGPVLASLPQLETLCLMGNKQLTVADVLPIARMCHLTYLVLWDCAAVPEAFRRALSTPDDIAAAREAIATLAT